jgi:hypothetical protein
LRRTGFLDAGRGCGRGWLNYGAGRRGFDGTRQSVVNFDAICVPNFNSAAMVLDTRVLVKL